MSRQLKRTKAQRRWRRKGYTHEAAYWSAQSGTYVPWNFILVLRPSSAGHFRRNQTPDDWIRPISQQFIHKGRKP